MKNKSGILKKVLTGVITSAVIMMSVSVQAAENPYIIYETDFEDKTAGIFEQPFTYPAGGKFSRIVTSENNADGWYFYNDKGYSLATDENGNKWWTATGDRNAIYNFKEGINEGKLYVSYEFQLDVVGSEAQADRGVTFRYRVEDKVDENGVISYTQQGQSFALVGNISAKNANFYSRKGFSTASTSEKTLDVELEAGRVYKVDVVADYDTQNVYVAFDGSVVKSAMSKSMKESPIDQVWFPTNKGYNYDNIKIARMTDESFAVNSITSYAESVEIEFTEMLSPDISLDEITLTNLFTGETVTPDSVEYVNENTLKITCSDVEMFDEYKVNLPDNFSNIAETKLRKDLVVYFDNGDSGLVIKSVSFTDYKDKNYDLANKISPLVKSITLGFNEAPEAINLKDNVEFKSVTTGAVVDVDFEVQKGTDSVTLLLDSVFFENEEYTMSIKDSALLKEYDILFATSEGELEVTGFDFEKDGEKITADELTSGDLITVRFTVLKPIREEQSIFLSCGTYVDGLMTDFNIQKSDMTENQTFAQGEIMIEVPESENFEIKGFLWGKAGGYALTKQVELIK